MTDRLDDIKPGEIGNLSDLTPGSIQNVNPGYPTPGRTHNCMNCSIATDATLAGRPAQALPGTNDTNIRFLEGMFGAKFVPVKSQEQLVQVFQETGHGKRGIILGVRPDGSSHVFNVVNQRGTVRFLDGQTGGSASFEGFSQLHVLPTN